MGGRPRKYLNNAEKQAAYRARKREEQAQILDGKGAGASLSNRSELEAAIVVPAAEPYFEPDPALVPILSAAPQVAEQEGALNLLLVGEPGSGKTSTARWLAAKSRRRHYVFNCGSVRDPQDWWGRLELRNGQTKFRASALAHALTLDHAVVVLDELNRCSTYLLNPLLPLLDERRETYSDALEQYVRVGHGTVLIATMNEGPGFAGTFAVDEAVASRFPTMLTVNPPNKGQMVRLLVETSRCSLPIARQLVDLAEQINQHARTQELEGKIGIRQLKAAARWAVAGAPLLDVCVATFANGFNADGGTESARYRVRQMVLGKLNPGAKTKIDAHKGQDGG